MSRRFLPVLIATIAGWLLASTTISTDAPQPEVRALWVVRTTLTSPTAVAAMVTAAKESGFNTLVVQVRGRADAYYRHATEPRAAALEKQPGFDPLAEAIARAHEAGLRVHAWVNVNLVTGIGDLPAAREHVVYRHPEWLMVPRPLAAELSPVDPRKREYLERLAEHVRREGAGLEGLYLSPIPSGAAQYTVSVVRNIVRRYKVDGVHLDYVRYPSGDFDYSRESLAAFRREVIGDLTTQERRTYDARQAESPLFYAQMFPERFRAFRADRLTALVSEIRRTVKRERPGAVLSAAVVPDSVEAATHRFQNWPEWLDRDLIDVVCPMAYTTDASLFAAQIAAARGIAGTSGLWAGIGAYRLSSTQIASAVQAARKQRVDGVILFSYDSLIDPARGADQLAAVGRAAFSSQ